MKILLLDDENSLRLAIRDELMDNGHKVYDYADPTLAFKNHTLEEFDCIISDIRMPKIDGIEILESMNAMRHRDSLVRACLSNSSGFLRMSGSPGFDCKYLASLNRLVIVRHESLRLAPSLS